MTRRRRWLQGCVIAIAALASIATSKRRWFLEAELPQTGITGPALVVVESSREPFMMLEKPAAFEGAMPDNRALERPSAWPATTKFLVPTGFKLSAIHMPGDHCKGGFCSSDCTVPDGEYVRIVKTAKVATWTLEVRGEQRTDTLDPAISSSHKLEVISSEPTVRLTIDSTIKPASVSTTPFAVYWPELDGVTTVTWTPRIVMEGLCPTETPCEPPETAKLEIRGVKDDSYPRMRARDQ